MPKLTIRRHQLRTKPTGPVCTRQHTTPCVDCPWTRTALPGWLGGISKEEWVQLAHGDGLAECHTKVGPQCAGLAIYRANVAKRPRDPKALVLPQNPRRVFSSPAEFLDHHAKVGDDD